MKNKKIFIILGVVAILIIGVFYFFGPGLIKKVPDLHKSKWQSISVKYLPDDDQIDNWEPNDTVLIFEQWSTTDQTMLDQLQESFAVLDSGDLWGYSTMDFNKIELELANGRKYVLHFSTATQMVLNDYEKIKTGFKIDVTFDFYNTLKSMIKADTNEPVFFF